MGQDWRVIPFALIGYPFHLLMHFNTDVPAIMCVSVSCASTDLLLIPEAMTAKPEIVMCQIYRTPLLSRFSFPASVRLHYNTVVE